MHESLDAIVFLPGIGEESPPQPVVAIAQRMARALDLRHPNAQRRFIVESVRSLGYGVTEPREAAGMRVVEVMGDERRAIFDVYKVDYRQKLYSEALPKGIRSIMRLAISLSAFFFRWLTAWVRPSRGLSSRKRMQLFLGGLAVGLVTVVLLLFVVAAASTIPWLANQIDADFLGHELDLIFVWLSYAYAALVALGGTTLFVEADIRKQMDALVARMIALQEYLEDDRRRDLIRAELRDALEAIAESPNQYRRVILIGYSFGSIVALDATILQPARDVRIRQYVKTVVTIGCPVDFIETYWNGYFCKSGEPAGTVESKIRWINVYAPADVLGSQFGTKGETGKEQETRLSDVEFRYPESRQTSSGGYNGMVNAFMSHGLYWDPAQADNPAVFGPIMQALYLDEVPE